MGKLKNGKAIGKDEVKGEMIKGRGNRVVDWIWRVCNMTFESGVVLKDWRAAVTVSLYKDKGEKTVYVNYRGINLLSVVGKIYVGILIDKLRKVTEGLTDDEEGDFRDFRCIDQIFPLE